MNKIIKIKNFQIAVKARHFGIAAQTCAKGDVRYYLDGVNIEPGPDGKGAVMVGTDGHRLIAMHDADGICKQNLILNARLAPLIAACLKSAKLTPFLDIMLVLTDDAQLLVGPGAIVNGGDHVSIEPAYHFPGDPRIDGKYPDWRRVVPTEDLKPGLPGQYNGSYLHDFFRVSALVESKHHGIQFFSQGGSKDTSILIRTLNKDFIGVLMPMRMDNFEPLPEWARPAAA